MSDAPMCVNHPANGAVACSRCGLFVCPECRSSFRNLELCDTCIGPAMDTSPSLWAPALATLFVGSGAVSIVTGLAHLPLHLAGLLKLETLHWVAAIGALAYGTAALVAGILALRWRARQVVWIVSILVHISGILVYAAPTVATLPLGFCSLLGLGGIVLFRDEEVRRLYEHSGESRRFPTGYLKKAGFRARLAWIVNALFALCALCALGFAVVLGK